MHYKKKKYKYKKSNVLDSSIKGWNYGGAIAREIINRQEFKKYRDSVMVAQASPKRLV